MTKQTQDKSLIRFPDGLRDRVSAVAKKNHRSINAEIVHRLEQSFAVDLEKVEDLIDMLDVLYSGESNTLSRIIDQFKQTVTRK